MVFFPSRVKLVHMTFNKRQKIGLAIALPLIVLLGVLYYKAHSLDAHKIIQIAANQVKSLTGRELQIRGPVSVTLFPRITVVAEQVTLSNPSWATDPDMLTAGRVAMTLRWAPLLHKLIEVDDVTLEKAVLSLQAAPAGQQHSGNWVLDVPSGQPSTSAFEDSFVFNINQIHLSQVQINYRDQSRALSQSATIKRLDITESGAQSLLDGSLTLNTLPVDLKGNVSSLTRLLAAGDANPAALALDLNLNLAGQPTKVQGKLTLTAASTPAVDLKIQSQALDLRLLNASVSAQALEENKKSAPSGSKPKRVFSDTPLGMDQLPIWQGTLGLDIASLTLPDGLVLKQFNTMLVAEAGDNAMLTLSPLTFQLGEGRVTASGTLSGLQSAQPTIQGRGYATGFSLGHLMAQLGESKELTGGPTVMAFHLNSRGATPHAIAANMAGEVQISVGPAVVSSTLFNNSGDFLVSVLNTVNPLRKSTDQNNLQCLVAYLPIQKGVVRINQSVGMRSDRLDVTLDGNLDLGAETLALKIIPQQRSGLTTGVSPAGLVQINGTFLNPGMGINKTGVVKQAAGVGLAIVTGGVSLIAQNAAGVVTRSNPCDNVLRPWPQVAGGLAINH